MAGRHCRLNGMMGDWNIEIATHVALVSYLDPGSSSRPKGEILFTHDQRKISLPLIERDRNDTPEKEWLRHSVVLNPLFQYSSIPLFRLCAMRNNLGVNHDERV
jgi:hypothetical protein